MNETRQRESESERVGLAQHLYGNTSGGYWVAPDSHGIRREESTYY